MANTERFWYNIPCSVACAETLNPQEKNEYFVSECMNVLGLTDVFKRL